MKKQLVLLTACILLSRIALAEAPWRESVNWSGFASVSATQSDNETPLYINREITDELCLDCDTTLGLQLDLMASEPIRGSLQVVKRSQDTFSDPTLEWGYLGWRPSDGLDIRVGRLRESVFLALSAYYVGNTYPWARPPAEVYNSVLGETYLEGIDLTYSNSVGDQWQLDTSLFIGEGGDRDVDLGWVFYELNAKTFSGGNVLLSNERWTLSASLFNADFHVDYTGTYVNGGYDDTLLISTLGVIYDWDWLEIWVELQHDKDYQSGYIQGAYHFGTWSPYIGYAVANERADSQTFTLGIEYMLMTNLSVNLEYQYTEATDASDVFYGDPGNFMDYPQSYQESDHANVVTLMLNYFFN